MMTQRQDLSLDLCRPVKDERKNSMLSDARTAVREVDLGQVGGEVLSPISKLPERQNRTKSMLGISQIARLGLKFGGRCLYRT